MLLEEGLPIIKVNIDMLVYLFPLLNVVIPELLQIRLEVGPGRYRGERLQVIMGVIAFMTIRLMTIRLMTSGLILL